MCVIKVSRDILFFLALGILYFRAGVSRFHDSAQQPIRYRFAADLIDDARPGYACVRARARFRRGNAMGANGKTVWTAVNRRERVKATVVKSSA